MRHSLLSKAKVLKRRRQQLAQSIESNRRLAAWLDCCSKSHGKMAGETCKGKQATVHPVSDAGDGVAGKHRQQRLTGAPGFTLTAKTEANGDCAPGG